MDSTMIPFSPLIEGADATPMIVAVEPAGADAVVLYIRAGDGSTTTHIERFRPWLVAAKPAPWQGLKPQAEIEQLAGDHPLRFLIRFSSWNAFADASRAARESGERFFSIGSRVDQYLLTSGRTLFKKMEFPDVRRLQLDIETLGLDPAQEDHEIVIVTLRMNGGHERAFVQRTSETELLEEISEVITLLDPDVIEGHNLFNFDLPFLATRAFRHGVRLGWGRDGSELRIGIREQRFKAGALTSAYRPAYVSGRQIVDTYQQIQRFDVGGNLTSYGLKPAVEALGLTRPGRTFVEGPEIAAMWRADPDRLVEYALDDVRDVQLLSDLTLPTEFYQTKIVPRGLQSVATIGPGSKINDLMVRAYVAARHSLPMPRPSRGYPGGYTEVVRTGVFSPVVKCDVESLYPSIMLQQRIRAESDTLDISLPLLEELTRRRLHAKGMLKLTQDPERAVWDGLQSSFKVLINSFYGYLGFSGALFNDFDAAERVTLAGQSVIRAAVAELQREGAKPIEIDTDGVYFVPPATVGSELDEIALVDSISSLLPEGIRLAHDGRYRAMLSLAMKTYALEGYDERLIMKGSALRSRKLEPCFRSFLAGATQAFMHVDRVSARDLYFRLAARIRDRQVDVNEIGQWTMIHAGTVTKQPRLVRMFRRLDVTPRDGERVMLYEREDGELAMTAEFAQDQSVGYLLNRLSDTAARFRPLFESDSEFAHFFPPLSARTDLEAAKAQSPSKQIALF